MVALTMRQTAALGPALGAIPVCGRHLLPARQTVIRANRMLAWAIVVSPLVQIATRTTFVSGLLFDLALIAVHGALSLALFGLPRSTDTLERRVLLTTGIGMAGPSPRNRLLLGGYRILLGLGYFAAIILVGVAWPRWAGDAGMWIMIALLFAGMFAMLRLPFSCIGHVYAATGYAARRGTLRTWPRLVAWLVTVAFLVASMWNLVK